MIYYSDFGTGVVTDPHWASVKMLIGANGANASTTFLDESPAARTLSTHGFAQIDTAQAKFGVSSAALDGSTAAISALDSADFNLANGLFTIEMFIRPNIVTGTQFLMAQWQNPPTLGWALNLSGATLRLSVSTTGSDSNVHMAGGTIVTSSWQHVCADFDGTKYRLYVNGSMVASTTTLRTFFNSTDKLVVGASSLPNGFFYAGYIDEARLTKGVARYASDSGFTVPTAAFPRS